jgi:hypothetical protein
MCFGNNNAIEGGLSHYNWDVSNEWETSLRMPRQHVFALDPGSKVGTE